MSLHPFESRLAASWPPPEWRDVTVLVAVSGGADSIALLRALAAIREAGAGTLAVVHYIHGWRPEAAEAEAQFVSMCCATLGLPCRCGRSSVPIGPSRDQRTEALARSARYDFIADTASDMGARFVVTAHTADDQAETVLHRILRGTGLAGLAGIPRARPLFPGTTLLRPLLHARRAQVIAYLADLGQDYCRDASNDDLTYTRNRLRHELLPQLARDYNPQIVEALVRLGRLADEAQQILQAKAEALAERNVRVLRADEIVMATAGLAGEAPYLVREVFVQLWRRQGWPLLAMSQAQWDALAQLATEGGGAGRAVILPGKIEARRLDDEIKIVVR